MQTGFRITEGKGIQVKFDNGVTVSIQFGVGNYCEHHVDSVYLIGSERRKDWESRNAEVAIWKDNGEWITKEYDNTLNDDVIGWLPTEKVLDILNWAKNY